MPIQIALSCPNSAPPLPVEVIEMIVSNAVCLPQAHSCDILSFRKVARELLSFLLVNKRWREATENVLYRTVVLDLSEGVGYTGEHWQSDIRARKLLRTLEENEILARRIHNLVLRFEPLCPIEDDNEWTWWARKLRMEYSEYNPGEGLTGALIKLVKKCHNLKQFVADRVAASQMIFFEDELTKKEGLKVLMVAKTPDMIERDFASTYSKPVEILNTLVRHPNMTLLVLKHFIASPDRLNDDWLNFICPPSLADDDYLDAHFLRSFRSIWRNPVNTFSAYILPDPESAAAMINCLTVWRTQLRVLRLFARYQNGYNSKGSMLTEAISQLALNYLDTTSDVLHPSAFLNVNFATLHYLRYRFVSYEDFEYFYNLVHKTSCDGTGTGLLPNLDTLLIDVDVLKSVEEDLGGDEVLTSLRDSDYILDFFDARGVREVMEVSVDDVYGDYFP